MKALPLVFLYQGRTIVYQVERGSETPVARVFGTKETLPITPELQAAIADELVHQARKEQV